jgi:hypothetical protein
MNFHGPQVLARLPVPEPELAIGITRCEELTIWAKIESTCVARIEVPCELLLPVHLEVSLTIIYHDLIVHGLSSEVFPIGVHSGSGHCMHIWLTDVLGYHWDAELPQIDLFVIGS